MATSRRPPPSRSPPTWRGVAAFLAGDIKVDGDLVQLVAMQTAEPSAAQLRLAQQIAAVTA